MIGGWDRAGDPVDVFVSYARVDADQVDRLVDALDRVGLSVWRDSRDSDDFDTGRILDGLARSRLLLA